MAAKKEKLSFEEAMERLEKISAELESGSIGLERSLEIYAEGVSLLKECTKRIEDAEKTVKSGKTPAEE